MKKRGTTDEIKEVEVIGTHGKWEILYEKGDELSELQRKLGTKEEQKREERIKKRFARIEKLRRKREKKAEWIAKLENKGIIGAIGIRIVKKL